MTVKEALKDRLWDFLEYSGYSIEDILAYNLNTGKISTKNGGLYQIAETGEILHLTGPSPDPTDRI